ncbi:MAG: DUF4446 family protein [Candidatus Moranbacteria bacterium]|nr:DUF4446 family protein [Candidatus Moranbacteria bacterium]
MENSTIIYILSALIGTLLIWNIFLQISTRKLNKNQKGLFAGKKGTDLESIVLENNAQIKKLSGQTKDLYEQTNEIRAHSLKSIHKVGLLRFNPFREIGGDQSFSLALLDDENNGAIISSLYSREGVRIYSKSIQKGESVKHPLTEEEKRAIAIASIEKNNQVIKKRV